MNLDQIETKCFILALFIRDDGERFLLGSRAYEFVDSQLHFVANSYQNDIVEVQGNDGIMLAGQVRRGTSQPFDGYIGDQTVDRTTIEQYRRDFMKFFRKNHYYKVVYVFPDGSAVQRRNGFIVEAPEVKELYQLFPQYHISMNFEDINYYVYEEDSEGEEIYGESATLKIATSATGGLIWEEGTESEISGEGSQFTLQDTIDGNVLDSVQLKGDTTQQTYSGQNLYNFTDTFAVSDGVTVDSDGWITITYDNSGGSSVVYKNYYTNPIPQLVASTEYDIYLEVKNVSGDARLNLVDNSTASSNGSQFAVDVIPFFNTLSNNSVYKYTSTTKSDMSNAKTSIRTYGQFRAGDSGTITFRITVTEHSSATADDFAYEPYVGGIPAPNPDYPQTVNTVTGRQVVTITDGGSESQEYEVNLGKNLFDKDNALTLNGNFDAGKPTIASNTYAASIYIPCEPNTTYTIQKNTLTNSYTRYIGYTSEAPAVGVTVSGVTAIPGTTGIATITTGSDAKYLVARVYHNTQDTLTFSEVLATIQIEKGSTATSYAPYISHFGKNLLDMNLTENGGINTSGVDVSASDNWRTVGYINAEPNTAYTYSMNGTLSQGYILRFYQYDSNHNFISPRTEGINGTITVTTDANTRYIRLSLYSYVGTMTREIAEGAKLMLEQGSTATPYQQFIGGQLELCKIGDYQDYIYKSGDDWYVHKACGKVEFDGTEGWYLPNSSSYPNLFQATLTGITINAGYTTGSTDLPAFCEYFTRYNSNDVRNNVGYAIYNDGGNVTARLNNNNYTTTTAFDNWLLSNDVSIYYALATATDIQITDSSLIAQLEALLGATTYDGQTAFTVSSENQLAILDVTVVARTGGGVVWDNYGAEWEEGTGGGPTMVNVDSIDNVYPVLTLTGPAVNPQISVLTTNTTLSYSGTVTASQELKIDMFNKTATLNGASVVGNVAGDWVYLKPGVNRITYTTNNADAPDSTIWWQEIVG